MGGGSSGGIFLKEYHYHIIPRGSNICSKGGVLFFPIFWDRGVLGGAAVSQEGEMD